MTIRSHRTTRTLLPALHRRFSRLSGLAVGLLWLGSLPLAVAQSGIDGMRLLGRNEQEFAHMMDFLLVGDHAYASVGLGSGLQTYDLSDPTQPQRLDSRGDPAWRAYARGDTLFSFGHRSGVQMFDIGAGIPVLMGEYDPPGSQVAYEDGVRLGDRLYVAAHQEGLHILDVGGPQAPEFVGAIGFTITENAAWAVVERDGLLYVANGRHGLVILEPTGPFEMAALDLPGLANDIALSEDGQTAFLSLGADGIASVDIRDPLVPMLRDTEPTLGNAFSLGLVGDILAVGSYPYAERFDVSDPDSVVRAGWDATKTYAMGADAGALSSGDTVIVVADWRGMAVYSPEDDPAGDIDIAPTPIDFGNVAAPRDTLVYVRNTGAGALQVTSIDPPDGISVFPETFTLEPGAVQPVTLTASGPNGIWGRIHYHSDDPDEGAVYHHVYANNTSFPQHGSEAPEFTLLGTDGQWHSLSDYRAKIVYLEFGANW